MRWTHEYSISAFSSIVLILNTNLTTVFELETMERNIFFRMLTMTITIIIVVSFPATEATSKLTCIDGFQRPTPEVTEQIKNCQNQEEEEGETDCIERCVDQVLGFLGDDGRPDKFLYWQWIDSDFFPQNREIAKEHMSDCFAKHENKIDPADDSCDGWKEFDACGWEIEPKMIC